MNKFNPDFDNLNYKFLLLIMNEILQNPNSSSMLRCNAENIISKIIKNKKYKEYYNSLKNRI